MRTDKGDDVMATGLKQRIAETVEKHALRSGLDKVTVNAVVSECNISRQAFYYYYQDIIDVARYIMKEKLDQAMKTGEEMPDPQAAVRFFAEDLAGQFPVISVILRSRLRGEIELMLIGELKDFFRTIFIRQNCGRELSRKQIEFQADLIACGLVGYAIEHCNDRDFDRADFSEQFWDMLNRTYGK